VANITITNIDTGSVVLELIGAEDGLLRNADADEAVAFVAGTILARHDTELKFYPYADGGANGLDVPVAVLTYDVDAVPLASDIGVRVLTAGQVNARRLHIHGGAPITAAHLDLLRSFSIVAIEVEQLGATDNS
jgi:hypothetical protein